MKYLKTITILSLISISLTACIAQPACSCAPSPYTAQNIQQYLRLQTIPILFNYAQTEGVFVTYNGLHLNKYGNALSRAETEYLPASTFKILNALIGLQHQKATATEVFKWDGKPRSYTMWEKDMTLAEAMQTSNVPVYQELAKRIGQELMQQEIQRLTFGNQAIGKQIDRFWLDGPLKITPQQQAEFVYKLASLELPFDLEVQNAVKQMLFIENRAGYKLYAKSGWAMDSEPQVGWYIGWVEDPSGKITAFALNMKMNKDDDVNERKNLTLDILDKLNILHYLK